MISRSTYSSDVRVRREAEALAAAGHQVTVVCLDEDHTPEHRIEVRGVSTPTGLRGSVPKSRRLIFILARWLLFPNHRRTAVSQFEGEVWSLYREDKLDADVVHAHDYPALGIAALIAEDQGAALVYDSHEVWTGLALPGRPSAIERRRTRIREGELARSADLVLTVSQGAAEMLASLHRLDNVHVIRNTFPVRRDLAAPPSPRGAVYAGRITRGRDLETVFTAFDDISHIRLHLIGPYDSTIRIPEHVEVHPTAELDVVERLLAHSGIGLVPLTKGPANHEVALPNKLFESVAVGIPVLAADLPEIRSLVETYGLGALYTPGTVQSFKASLDLILDDYQTFVDNVRAAQSHLDWSRDADALVSVYERLCRRRAGSEAHGH